MGLGRGGEVRFRTASGVKRARWSADRRGIDLLFGPVPPPAAAVEVEAAGRSFTGQLVTAGVPHFVVPVERVEWVPVQEWGAALRHHARFEPAGANVDFVARLGPSRVALRTYERGVEGETLACGTGATAVTAARGRATAPVRVRTWGGDELVVEFTRVQGRLTSVVLHGPAARVFVTDFDPA
jgi:diaminopimelate epimerase